MPLLASEGRAQWTVAGRVSAIGIELALSTFIGYFGGRWLDTALGTAPWLAWVGLGLGLVAGFKSLFVLARRAKQDLEPTPPTH